MKLFVGVTPPTSAEPGDLWVSAGVGTASQQERDFLWLYDSLKADNLPQWLIDLVLERWLREDRRKEA